MFNDHQPNVQTILEKDFKQGLIKSRILRAWNNALRDKGGSCVYTPGKRKHDRGNWGMVLGDSFVSGMSTFEVSVRELIELAYDGEEIPKHIAEDLEQL